MNNKQLFIDYIVPNNIKELEGVEDYYKEKSKRLFLEEIKRLGWFPSKIIYGEEPEKNFDSFSGKMRLRFKCDLEFEDEDYV